MNWNISIGWGLITIVSYTGSRRASTSDSLISYLFARFSSSFSTFSPMSFLRTSIVSRALSRSYATAHVAGKRSIDYSIYW